MTKTSLSKYISNLNFDRSFRGDCPVCGGSNTFSVTKENGKIWYYCFRNSCSVGGTITKENSYDEIRHDLREGRSVALDSHFDIPDYFVDLRDTHCNFLEHFNSLDAYLSGRVRCKYDPKLNRLVFLIGSSGAVGRALDRN